MLLACGKAKERAETTAPPASESPPSSLPPQQTPKPNAAAPIEVPVIRATQSNELRKMVHREIRIQGRIRSTNKSSSGHQFLNFYSSEVGVICFRDDVTKFRDTPLSSFVERDVILQGKIEDFKGKLQIELHDPSQISILHADSVTANSSEVTASKSNERPAKPGEAEIQRDGQPAQPSVLREVGKNHWVSAGGLAYRGVDPDGRSRREHILRHAEDDPDRDGPHGVFAVTDDEVFALIDEAWKKIETQKIRPNAEGNRVSYTVRMGRRVGYLGGSTGRDRGHPPLDRIFIVLEEGTHNVVTAFPK